MGTLVQFLVAELKLFHDDIAWSKKDLWAVDVLLSVMFMSFFLLVLWRWMAERLTNLDSRYLGARPCRHLKTMVISLSRSISFMGSHLSSFTSGWEGRNLFHEFSACQRTGASADLSDPSPLIQNVLFIGPSLPLWVLFGKYGVLQWISEGLKLHFKVLFSGVYQKILEIRWPEWTLGRWEVSPDLAWAFLGNKDVNRKSKTITLFYVLLAFERAISRGFRCWFASSCTKRYLQYSFRTELFVISGFSACQHHAAARSHPRWHLWRSILKLLRVFTMIRR